MYISDIFPSLIITSITKDVGHLNRQFWFMKVLLRNQYFSFQNSTKQNQKLNGYFLQRVTTEQIGCSKDESTYLGLLGTQQYDVRACQSTIIAFRYVPSILKKLLQLIKSVTIHTIITTYLRAQRILWSNSSQMSTFKL